MARGLRPVDRMAPEWTTSGAWMDWPSPALASTGRRPAARVPPRRYDGLFTFAALEIALCALMLGPLTPVLGLALLVTTLLLRPRDALHAFTRNWAIALLPIFALLSSVWSVNPPISAYYGIQFIITALTGILIGASINRLHAFYGLFLAFAVFCAVSVVFGRSVGWGDGGPGGTAFAGLVGSKNAAGDVAAIGAMASTAFFLRSLIRGEFPGAALAGAVLVLQIYLTLASQSSGAVIGLAVGCGFILVAGVACAIPSQFRVMLGLLLTVGLLGLLATSELWFAPLLESVAVASGKSPTLTGRTAIWEDAERLMRERPAFGLGFSAFWVQGNLDAEGIWRSMGIANRMGFNFHNTALEILVHLGWVGFALFAAVFVLQTVKLWARTTHLPDLPLIFWSGFVLYQLSRMYAEARGLKLFDYGTIMLFAGMAVATRSRFDPATPAVEQTSLR